MNKVCYSGNIDLFDLLFQNVMNCREMEYIFKNAKYYKKYKKKIKCFINLRLFKIYLISSIPIIL